MSVAGDILLTADGDEILDVDGNMRLMDGAGDGCCCGGGCPDTTGCPDRTVTITGSNHATCANRTYTLTWQIDGWFYSGPIVPGDFSQGLLSLSFACSGDSWFLIINMFEPCGDPGSYVNGSNYLLHRPGVDDCGRLGAYTVSGFVAGDTLTAVIS